MNVELIRDCIDCAVRLWMLFFFSAEMEKPQGQCGRRVASLSLFIVFVLFQRYILNQWTLSEAFLRNILLYLLTCSVMLSWRRGQQQYLIFLASIVFFLQGGWLKLFTPAIFASLHLPTFGHTITDAFPRIPVALAENGCRILATVLLKRYAFDISPDREISWWEGLLALFPAIIDHTTVMILYHLTTVAPSLQSAEISLEMTLLTLLLVFGLPLMLAATEQRFQLQRKELSLLQMEHQMKAQIQSFEQRQLSDAQARRIYHDLSKQMSVLEGMTAGGTDHTAPEKLLTDMIRQTGSVVPQIHTGNAVLDTLLSQKETQCQTLGITLECMVDFRRGDFLRYADIVTTFSNALDNAIEAVEKNPSDARRIVLSAGMIGGHLIVKCRNPYQGSLKPDPDGLFATSKAEPELHGIGLRNLKRIVESYQGTLHIEADRGEFLVEWMIPIPDEG